MARYIDADALKRLLHENSYAITWDCVDFTEGMALKDIFNIIKDAQTVDVQEVRHGRWEEVVSVFMDVTTVVYLCSECGATSFPRYKYCPNCGARMEDLQEDEVGAYALDPMIRRLVDSDVRMDR